MFLQMAMAGALALCQPYYDESQALHGYKSCDGQVALAPKYIMAAPFGKGGIAAVLDDTGWHYINRRGALVIRPLVFDNGPDYFSDGLARYKEGGKYGFFNTAGAIVIAAQFEFAYPFAKGRAKVGEDCTFTPDGEHTRVECRTWRFIGKPLLHGSKPAKGI